MDYLDNQNDYNYMINSDYTINCLLSSFKFFICKRYNFLRNLLISLNIIQQFRDKVTLKHT